MLSSRLCLRGVAARPCFPPLSASSSFPYRHLGFKLYNQRVFATTPRHRKADVARIQTEAVHDRQESQEGVKPESVKKDKPAETTKNDPLLAEQTVSNKEQRKADWAIIKDMAHYLWPKDDFGTRFRVGLSVGLLIGAKVRLSSSSYCRKDVDSVHRFSMSKYRSTSNLS